MMDSRVAMASPEKRKIMGTGGALGLFVFTVFFSWGCKEEKPQKKVFSTHEGSQVTKKGRGESGKKPDITPEKIPPFQSPRKPCQARYTRLIGPRDIRQVCHMKGDAPISFAYPSGCLYRYPQKGAFLIMESPSFRKLKQRFPQSRRQRLGNRWGFSFSPQKGSNTSVVLRAHGDMALLLQSPTALCKKAELLNLAQRVSKRLTSKP